MHFMAFLALQIFLATGCASPRAPQVSTVQNPSSQNGDDYIRLTQESKIRAVVRSSPEPATFKISGLGIGSDVILPATTIAKIVLPKHSVTITATNQCYPDIVHYLQLDERSDGIDVNFVFSNANRKPDCGDEGASPTESSAKAMSASDSQRKLAWVITNSDYGDSWIPLTFVENDRDRIAQTFARAGYKVLVSHNQSHDQILADEAGFRRELGGQTWDSVIVYISGHGVGLRGGNYLVPRGAPAVEEIKPTDLLSISQIASDLDPVADAGTFALVLVDACRSNPEFVPVSPLKVEEHNVLVNYSAAPGSYSFAGDIGMSFWTQRFVEIADVYPGLPTDRIVQYANAYTRWQSRTSLRVQSPVLVGRAPASAPMFGTRNFLPRGVIVAPISSSNS